MTGAITGFELALLVAGAWPALRVAAHPPLRRLFPGVPATALTGVAAWLALVALIAIRYPSALHALAIGVAAVFVAAFARDRLRRRLPPGTLSFATSLQAVADRSAYLRQAERLGPIFKVAQFHRPVICVVGLERIHRLLQEHADALAPNPQPMTRQIAGGFLRYMDDDTYATYGPLFRKALSQQVVDAARPATVDAAARELDRLASHCGGTPAVAPGPYLEPIAFDALVRALLGLARVDAEHARFASSYRPLAAQSLAAPLTAETKQALAELRPLVQRARGERASALTELQRIDPAMPDAICVDNLLFTLKLASADVVSLLHWNLAMLGRQPEWGARVGADGAVAERFVLETLRLAQSEYLYRVVTEEFEFEGFRFPKRWLLRLCVWESHRSPEAFDDPERFDPDRFATRSFRTSEYSPFGWGPHACNGAALATAICATVIETLASGYRWQVSGDGAPERGFRHWHHWRPSSRLRLAVAPLAD